MTLLDVAHSLWREAYRNSVDTADRPRLERAIKCLYAGLELVLPTALEIQFRLLLAHILQTHTEETVEACEHLRKSLRLLQTRSDCPLQLRLLAIAMWCGNGTAAPDTTLMRHLSDGRKLAVAAEEFAWWMHFDWLAWRRGHLEVLRESLSLLASGDLNDARIVDCRLFLLVLLAYADRQVVADELHPLVEQQLQQDLSQWRPSTMVLLAALLCLRERVERGESEAARILFERCASHIEGVDGLLPGMLRVEPSILQHAWARLVAIISLRAGETPVEAIQNLIPDQVLCFQTLTTQHLPPGSSLSIPSASSYAQTLNTLLGLLRDIPADPLRVLAAVEEIAVDSSQLESFRHLIRAVAARHSHQPVHRVKASLLESLKLLNGTTQNTLVKVVVLLLVGQLYLETDFEMAIKMNKGAYSFAATAQWDWLAYLAAGALSIAYRKLGEAKEAQRYADQAHHHQSLLPKAC